MSTLHENLLAAIAPLHHPRESPPLRRILEARDRALRAVVKLHAPEDRGAGDFCVGCTIRGLSAREYPCPTIRAIATALGVEIGETP